LLQPDVAKATAPLRSCGVINHVNELIANRIN
jgi:hypothetical protein